MSLATLTDTGRAAIAKAMAARPLHLAWGSGDATWDNPDFELPGLKPCTSLVHELGRRTPTSVGFVVPDDAGSIVIPVSVGKDGSVQEARYSLSATPTPYLYVLTHFNYGEASQAVIREMGVFMDTVTKPGLPPGQRYFTPAELDDPGLLLAVQILRPSINRSPSIRQSFEFVVPI